MQNAYLIPRGDLFRSEKNKMTTNGGTRDNELDSQETIIVDERKSKTKLDKNRIIEKIITAVILMILEPLAVWLRLHLAKTTDNIVVSDKETLAYVLVTFFLLLIFAVFVKFLIYDPMENFIISHRGQLWRLRSFGIVVIALQLGILYFALQIVIHNHKIDQLVNHSSVEILNAKSAIGEYNQKLSPKIKKLLEDVAISLNYCSSLRKDIIDTTHHIDSLKVDIFWHSHESVTDYYYYGKCNKIDNCDQLNKLYWADFPIYQLENRVIVTDLMSGSKIHFEVATDSAHSKESPARRYYIGIINGIRRKFAIKESVTWPCGLYRSPDGVIIDTCKFQQGIDKLHIRIITENGITLLKIFKFRLNPDKSLNNIELEGIKSIWDQETVEINGHEYCMVEYIKENPATDSMYFVMMVKNEQNTFTKEPQGESDGSK